MWGGRFGEKQVWVRVMRHEIIHDQRLRLWTLEHHGWLLQHLRNRIACVAPVVLDKSTSAIVLNPCSQKLAVRMRCGRVEKKGLPHGFGQSDWPPLRMIVNLVLDLF